MLFIKPKQLPISKDIEKLVQKFLSTGSFHILPTEGDVVPNASHINNGFCRVFAFEITKLYPTAVYYEKTYLYIPHAFVKYCGKYYDSETPDGVRNWMDLPIFK